MLHTHYGDCGKAAGESPGSNTHECQGLLRTAAQLPRQDGGEEVEDADGEPGSNEEVPVRAREPGIAK